MSIVYEYLKQIQQLKEPSKTVENEYSQKEKKVRIPYAAVSMWVVIGFVALVSVYLMIPGGSRALVMNIYQPKERPAVRTSSTQAGYVLEGIIYNPDHPFAVINGQMIENNGRIDDFVVMAITPNTVSLKNLTDRSERTLQL